MPLYMDVHDLGGSVSEADVAAAHEQDLATQGAYGVKYKKYWVDPANGKIFCLVEAPNPQSARAVHEEAHGLVTDQIYEVTEHT